MFSMTERRKSNCKFGGTKIFEADKIEHFINPKVENEAFDECVNLVWISIQFYMSIMVICSLDTMKKSLKKKETETGKEIGITKSQ